MSVNLAKAIYTKLAATSGVTSKVSARIYFDQAPSGAAYPMVIFSHVAGTKVRALQTPEAFKQDTWLIKAVDRSTSSIVADEIAAAIDTAFDGGTITVEGKTVADLHHVADVDYPENSGDEMFRHCGATYTVVLTAT